MGAALKDKPKTGGSTSSRHGRHLKKLNLEAAEIRERHIRGEISAREAAKLLAELRRRNNFIGRILYH